MDNATMSLESYTDDQLWDELRRRFTKSIAAILMASPRANVSAIADPNKTLETLFNRVRAWGLQTAMQVLLAIAAAELRIGEYAGDEDDEDDEYEDVLSEPAPRHGGPKG